MSGGRGSTRRSRQPMKPETVLITRTEPGASKTAGAAIESGFEAIVSPLAHVVYLDADIDPAGFDAIAVTSRHGARGLAKAAAHRSGPVFAVGDATAQSVRRNGFEDVRSADGDGEALAGLMAASLPRGARILHARGERVAGGLKQALEARGFEVAEAILYRTVETERLTGEAVSALDAAPGPILLVHSPAGGQRLVAALTALGIPLQGLRAAAISQAASEPLTAAGIGRFETAHRPDDASLLDAAKRLGADPSGQ